MTREEFVKRLLNKEEDKKGNVIKVRNYDFNFNADKPYYNYQHVRISSK